MIDAVAAIVERGEDHDPDDTTEIIFDGIQLLLGHVAVLSRVFFPDHTEPRPQDSLDQTEKRQARRRRGEQLRAWFEVSDISPLNPPGRELRNTIEHWDERVERWHLDVLNRPFAVDSVVGSLRLPDHYVLRRYQPRNRTVSWAGDRQHLELTPLIQQAAQLLDLYPSRLAEATDAGALHEPDRGPNFDPPRYD